MHCPRAQGQDSSYIVQLGSTTVTCQLVMRAANNTRNISNGIPTPRSTAAAGAWACPPCPAMRVQTDAPSVASCDLAGDLLVLSYSLTCVEGSTTFLSPHVPCIRSSLSCLPTASIVCSAIASKARGEGLGRCIAEKGQLHSPLPLCHAKATSLMSHADSCPKDPHPSVLLIAESLCPGIPCSHISALFDPRVSEFPS